MSLPLANTLETGQPDGTTITTGNSGGAAGNAWDQVTINSGCTATYVTSPALHGALSAKFFMPSALFVSTHWVASAGTFTEIYGRVYFQFPALPTGRNRCVFISTSGGAQGAAVSLESSGKFRAYDSIDGNTESTATLAPNTPYRLEWHYVASLTVGSIEARVYPGNSTSALDTVLRSGVNTAASSNQVVFGGTTGEEGGAFTIYLDDMAVNATGFPGPSPAGQVAFLPQFARISYSG